MPKDQTVECTGCSRRDALSLLLRLGITVVTLGVSAGCPGGSTWGRSGAAASGAGGGMAHGRVEIPTGDVPPNTAVEFSIGERSGYLVHLAGGEWIALDRKCTHKGTLVEFKPERGEFVCPNHHSEFSLAGEVLKKPAKRPLARFNIEVRDSLVVITA